MNDKDTTEKSVLMYIPEDFKFPYYDSIINRIPVVGAVGDWEYLTTPLVQTLKNIDVLPDNVRLLTSEKRYNSLIKCDDKKITNPTDVEYNGYKIHYHSYNNVVYVYIYKEDIEIPASAKYNSIALKIGSEVSDNNYYIKEKQKFEYGSVYVANNSDKCIRINIPMKWSEFDKSYLLKGDKTSEF
jgi:hypothetical protein